MRNALARQGVDPASLQPTTPVHLVVDHSVAATHSGHAGARLQNELEAPCRPCAAPVVEAPCRPCAAPVGCTERPACC